MNCPLGIGTMMWGTTWLDKKVAGYIIPDDEINKITTFALSHNLTLFDTAEGYGGGSSELRLRSALQANASSAAAGGGGRSLTLMTKFLPTLWRWTEASLLRAVANSNKRLGISCCPIYFIHSPVHPLKLEIWVRAAARAHKAGTIGALGLSNFNADQVRRAHAAASSLGMPIVANQIMFNLLVFKSPKLQETVNVCHELGIKIIAYAPIGQGLLTDNLTTERMDQIRLVRMAGLKSEAAVAELANLRTALDAIAQARGKTMAQIAIAWVASKDAVPLVGVRKLTHLQDAFGAVDGTWALAVAEVKALDDAAMGRHTFEKPRWRRSLFIVFISLLMTAYKVSDVVSRAVRWLKFW